MELISEYLAADTSPDASPDALAIINIGKSVLVYETHLQIISILCSNIQKY